MLLLPTRMKVVLRNGKLPRQYGGAEYRVKTGLQRFHTLRVPRFWGPSARGLLPNHTLTVPPWVVPVPQFSYGQGPSHRLGSFRGERRHLSTLVGNQLYILVSRISVIRSAIRLWSHLHTARVPD